MIFQILGMSSRYLVKTNSTETTYKEMLNKLITKLKERGYKQQDILQQTKCTKFETRKLARTKKENQNHQTGYHIHL